MSDFVVLDTSVISRLTKPNSESLQYQSLLGDRLAAISFQTGAELLSAQFGTARQSRLESLLRAVTVIGHQRETSVCYAAVADARRALKRQAADGGDAADGDVWIVATALEHSLPLISHDVQQVHVARSVGVQTFTLLPGLTAGNPSSP